MLHKHKKQIVIVGCNGREGSIAAAKFREGTPRLKVLAVINRHKDRLDALGSRNFEITSDLDEAIKSCRIVIFTLRHKALSKLLEENNGMFSKKIILSCDAHYTANQLSRVTGSPNAGIFMPSAPQLLTKEAFVPVTFSTNITKPRKSEAMDVLARLGKVLAIPQKMMQREIRYTMLPALIAAFLLGLVKADRMSNGSSKETAIKYLRGAAELTEIMSVKDIVDINATPGGLIERILKKIDFNELARSIWKQAGKR